MVRDGDVVVDDCNRDYIAYSMMYGTYAPKEEIESEGRIFRDVCVTSPNFFDFLEG